MSLEALRKRLTEKAVEGIVEDLMKRMDELIAEVRKISEQLDEILELIRSAQK